MDLIDRANDAAEMLLADAIERQALRAARTELLAYGACYYCSERVDGQRLFCNQEHAREWQRERDQRRRNGDPS